MKMNNQIWMMTSALPAMSLPQIIEENRKIGAQGLEICVFRRDGSRQDHVATHMDYENFSYDKASDYIDQLNSASLKFSIGAYENLIGGDLKERVQNQNHLLKLIRMAHLMGGDENGINVGTFVGFNHEQGVTEGGFEKNLQEYKKVFTPIIKYAEDLGVTVVYENCPMEGWRSSGYYSTFNNLPGVLAARKLMYALIPSPAHGETYDPSHDVWQHTDPVEVIKHSDMKRIKTIHIKSTRFLKNAASVYWGGMYANQMISPDLAAEAGVPVPAHDWDRQNYEAMLPGFGGTDSMDWRALVEILKEKNFKGAFSIENEASLSKGTGNSAAIVQGFQAGIYNLMPMIWPLTETGYQYDNSNDKPLSNSFTKDVPIVTMSDLS
jgi:sugar phosphate isomerase/epimerase